MNRVCTESFSTPLLLVVFNRPDLTQRVFESVRRVAPRRLYIAADAPRENRPEEIELTQQTRAITEQVDWDCDVTRLYADQNMGCGRRISSAISAVLERHESVIILEDDCLPDPSFFGYCERLLDRYADDQRVMAISGDNFQNGRTFGDASYYFSKYPHCWGWATWRRAWKYFDLNMFAWPRFRDEGGLKAYCNSERELEFWQTILDQTHAGKIDTWDLQWTLSCWLQHGLTILPNQNLVSNIGFRADGTHTTSDVEFANLPTQAIAGLRHPEMLHANFAADQHTDELLYSGPWKRSQQKHRGTLARFARSIKKRVA